MDFQVHGLDSFDLMVDYWDGWWPDQPLRLLAESAVEDAQLRLEGDNEGPNGEPWEPWSTDYAKTRRGGDKLLHSSGDLAASLDAKRSGNDYIVISDLDYALVHQQGSKDGRTKARPYVGISDDLEASLNEYYSDDFDRGWSATVRA